MKSRDKRRIALRHPIEATVACRPFTSRGTPQSADAVMRNFSDTGSYIESTHAFGVGTVIQVRPDDERIGLGVPKKAPCRSAATEFRSQGGDAATVCLAKGRIDAIPCPIKVQASVTKNNKIQTVIQFSAN